MPIFRVEKHKGYTVMSNFHLRDKRLSLKAKGLLSQILSLPENWDNIDFNDRRQVTDIILSQVYATGDRVSFEWKI